VLREAVSPLSDVVVAGARDSSGPVPARAARRIPATALQNTGKATGVAGATAQASTERSVLGCYRLRFDASVDLQGFPDAFRLERDSSVHALFAGGDSVLSGATWSMTPTSVLVTVGEAAVNRQTLLFAPDRLTATLARLGSSPGGRVERLACPR
jgi:hypothetical protein